MEHGAHFLILYYPHLRRTVSDNTVRNFPTHGQPSAAQGSLTSCLNFDFAILNLFEPSAPWSDGPEVEHWAHFLILYYPLTVARLNQPRIIK